MAVKAKEKPKMPPKKKIIDVSASVSDSEILALEEKNYQLRFNEKDFRELPESVIEKLCNSNARDYFMTKGAFNALKKANSRKEAGFEGLEVQDPLRGKPRRKLEVAGKLKGWHYCWKRPDEVEESKKLGYVVVKDEVNTPGASSVSSSHTITAKDGKDDLVLMRVEERLFQQHLQANAVLSRRRAGATMKEITGMVKKANKHLEDVELPNLVETTEMEEVPIAVDMARR